MRVSELKNEMDARFAQMDARFSQVDARFDVIEKKIREEGEATRLHIDVLYEKFKADLQVSLDKSVATGHAIATLDAVNAAEHTGFVRVLDDHEARLKAVERS